MDHLKIKKYAVKSFASLAVFITFGLLIQLSHSTEVVKGFTPTFSFLAAGDFGANVRTAATLDLMTAQSANFTLALGDMSYDEVTPESAWCTFVKSHVGAEYPFELISGNHEEDGGPDGHIANYAACLPDRLSVTGVYTAENYFDYPPSAPIARFIQIAADSPVNGVVYDYNSGTHRIWLESRIDEARAAGLKWVIVSMHKNCITLGEKGCEIGESLMNVLIDKKVDVVLQGHEHNYMRGKQLALNPACPVLVDDSYNANCVVDHGSDNFYTKGAGTIFLISGLGGRTNRDLNLNDPEAPYFATWAGSTTNQVNGFSKFLVSEDEMQISFMPAIGGYTDSFTISGTGITPSPTPTGLATPTPAPTETIIVPVSEDATIKVANPTTNFGTSNLLEVDSSGEANFLMKFLVSGVNGRNVVSSKINLYNRNSSNFGGAFNKVLTNTWTESTVNWNNAPASSGILSTLGAVSPGNWYKADVSQFVVGDGTYSFRVNSSSTDGADYASRQDASFKPFLEMVVESSPSGTPLPTSTPSNTPTPTFTVTPSPYVSPTMTLTPSPTFTASPTATPTNTPIVTPLPTILTFNPTDDASVFQSNPNNNYGSNSRIVIDNSPVKNFLMKFNVSGTAGKTVTRARIRLYNRDSSAFGGIVRRVLSNSWTQGTVTWNNAPASELPIIASFGAVSTNRWYEVDITPQITGDGVYSFRVSSTSTDGADYNSVESSTNKPQLVLDLN